MSKIFFLSLVLLCNGIALMASDNTQGYEIAFTFKSGTTVMPHDNKDRVFLQALYNNRDFKGAIKTLGDVIDNIYDSIQEDQAAYPLNPCCTCVTQQRFEQAQADQRREMRLKRLQRQLN